MSQPLRPPQEHRDKEYHWLRDPDGELVPVRWAADCWYFFGDPMPWSPFHSASGHYAYHAPAIPPT